MKIKIDPTKALSITVTVLGVAGTILGSVAQKNDRQAMKDELRNEILDEILKTK